MICQWFALSGLSGSALSILGTGAGALLAVHAAVLQPAIKNVIVIDGLLSYRLLIDDPLHRHHVSILLPDVLARYDIPDLYAGLADRRVLVVNPRDAQRALATQQAAQTEFEPAFEAFGKTGNPEAFSLRAGIASSEIGSLAATWLRG